ncbi:MAG: RraA family protein [Pseudomonadota bacterium]
MFVINERGPEPDDELIEMLKSVEPATVGHFKHDGFMNPSLRPVVRSAKLVGPAVTVKAPGADSTVVHKAIEIAQPGDVIVVDRCGDTKHACWGGLVTLAAYLNKVAGGIVDGSATDISEVEALGFPLYANGISALTTKLLGFGGEINTIVQCGGVTVNPGDLIVADDNGILVLRPDEAKAVAEKALFIQEKEKGLVDALKLGKALADLSGANALIAKRMAEKG